MIRKRIIGTAAAIGGFTVAIALLTGLPSARADELSDLRANQDLLQGRIDQLAQAAPGGPGTPVVSGSFPRSFMIPGTETSLRVGGQAMGNVVWYWHGSAVGGALGGQGGYNQTFVDGPGGTGNLPSTPLDLHNQIIPGPLAPATQTAVASHSRSTEIDFSGKASRIFLDARTPSPWGTVGAYVEMDFAASNTNTILNTANNTVSGYIPRLRKAYATLGGLLMGQDSGTFGDNDADPDILDQGGQTGSAGPGRLPMARYTHQLPYGMSVAIAIEQPDSDLLGPFGSYETDTNGIPTASNCTALVGTLPAGLANTITNACTGSAAFFDAAQNTVPNTVLRWRAEQPWGHLQIGAMVRDITINDGKFLNQNFMGYGASVSGNVKPWAGRPVWDKDNLTWQFTAGNGLGNGISNGVGAVTSNFGGPLGPGGVAATSSASIFSTNRQLYDSFVRGKTNSEYSARAGYSHWWTPELRSTVAISMNHIDANSTLMFASGSAANNKELWIGHLNLVWSPIAFVDLGIEYSQGHRQTTGNLKGDLEVMQGSLRVRF